MSSATAPTRNGYIFGGYYTQVSGGGSQYYDAAMTSGNNWIISSNTTLYAYWSPSYQSWSGGTSATADSNNDGVANSLAWLFGAANPSVNAITLQPTFDNTTDADYFIYTYRRSDAAFTASGTTIAVEYGSTLGSWTTAEHDGTNIIITPINDTYGTGVDKVEVKIKKTLAASGKLFSRLKVVIAP